MAARETGRQTSGSLCLSAIQTRRKGWRKNEQRAATSAASASVPALTDGGSNAGGCVSSSASPQVGHAAKFENALPNKDFSGKIDSIRQIGGPFVPK